MGITLIGKGLVPGAALDKSGLTGNICQAGNPANCVSKALFGGFGSALTYTGHNHVYIAAPDRGPFDGLTDVPYLDRVHFLKITTATGSPFPNINVALLDTRLLRNERGQVLVGAAGSFNQNNDRRALRFEDVSGVDSLPAGPLPEGITPVKKTLFIDLLDPAFNLAPTIAEKIEALAWGPDLPDGRHVLYIVSDNDLNPNLDTQIYAFAIYPSLIDFEKQFLPLPVYPPWLVPRD